MCVLKTLGCLLLAWLMFHVGRGFFGAIRDGRQRRARLDAQLEEEALETLFWGPPELKVYWPDG